MSDPKNRKPLTQEELEEMPGEPMQERAAMSTIGGSAIPSLAGGLTFEPPPKVPLDQPLTDSAPDES